mgnify:CR=1 FL=1
MAVARKKMDDAPMRPRESAASDASAVAQLAALKQMSVGELKAKWESLFGSPAPNNSRSYLELRLGYRIQELTFGGLSKPVRQLLDALADEVEGKKVRKSVIADPRNPVIGIRSFGDSPKLVADFGADFVRGQQDAKRRAAGLAPGVDELVAGVHP